MSEPYKAANYHDHALKVIPFSDGSKWTIRKPKASDRHLLTDIGQKQRKRHEAFAAELDAWKEDMKARALAATEASGDDDDGRRVIEDEESPLEVPDHLTVEYWHAEVLAAFISPTHTPEEVLAQLGDNEYDLDFMFERHAELMDTMEGGAAKKRVRGGAVR